ncbi:MAG: hypothetical protein M3O03_08770 [Pseudomonadota bacterium]|nr:hypothetical protein [Pseudomonadota bacterium]
MIKDDIRRGKDKAADKRVLPIKPSSKPDVTDLIGQRLRKYYDDVANQPVPDRFLNLLDQLEEASSSKKSRNER